MYKEYPLKVNKAYISLEKVDLRVGMDGLQVIAEYCCGVDPYEVPGTIFIFRGKSANRIKAILYDGTGLILLAKRMDKGKGRFHWPKDEGEFKEMGQEDFARLIQGLVPEGCC